MKFLRRWSRNEFRREITILGQAQITAPVDTLPAEQLEVLVLVCVENLTYAEAATVLNVPVETVVSRLLQARRSLIAFGQAGLWPSPNFSERRDLNAGSMEAGGSPLLPGR